MERPNTVTGSVVVMLAEQIPDAEALNVHDPLKEVRIPLSWVIVKPRISN